MRMFQTAALFAAVALAVPATSDAQAPRAAAAQPASAASTAAEPIFKAVRGVLSGDRAKETVAYMDRFVRWPGNPGFDSSIAHVVQRLDAAGYVEQSRARPTDRLTYRVERYPMANPAWEPVDAVVRLNGGTVLEFATNRNMLATNSFSTPAGGVTAQLVRVPAVTAAALDSLDLRGKFVMADGRLSQLFTEAVVRRGALGVLAYSMPAYTQPERNTRSIQFTSIPHDTARRAWGIALSSDARRRLVDALARGPVTLNVTTRSRFIAPATELAVVA
ncbi:MAG: hypothetical protein FJ202_04815, partial [Gemmatimonadetes bacterium]|nr:hypothetical protein [Gemmatimonadota bacterium]